MSNDRELKVNMMDVLETLVRRKWLILAITLLASIGMAIYTLVVTPKYEAQTVLMPPSSSETSGIKSILKNTALGKIGGLERIAGSVPNDVASIFMSILDSRTMRMDLIHQFSLDKVYKFDKLDHYYIEDLLKAVNKNIGYDLQEEGTIAVYVTDESPERAAAMANYMIHQLDDIYKRLTTEKNRNYRIFLGKRLEIVRKDLEEAEKNMLVFQKRNNMIDIESQAKATVTTGVNLEAKYLAVKGNLEVARQIYSADHPKVRELQLQMEQLAKQRSALSGEKVSDFLLPYRAGPDLALEFLRLKRDQEIQQAIFELMIQQYEEARFDESKNTPTIQVLDPAVAPQKRMYPKRRKMVQIAFLLALVASSVGVLLIDYAGKFSRGRPEEAARMRKLFRQAWAIRSGD